jgi:hypothetical protein
VKSPGFAFEPRLIVLTMHRSTAPGRLGGSRPRALPGRAAAAISALKAASPVLGNPANRHRAVPLTYDQFRSAFANAVSEEEAKEL